MLEFRMSVSQLKFGRFSLNIAAILLEYSVVYGRECGVFINVTILYDYRYYNYYKDAKPCMRIVQLLFNEVMFVAREKMNCLWRAF